MNSCMSMLGLYRYIAILFAALVMGGCITISEPIEEPSPIPLLATETPAVQSAASVPEAEAIEPVGQEVLADDVAEDEEAPPEEGPQLTPTATPEPTIYTVAPGDTLSVIAKRHEITTAALMAANDLTDADELQIDQKLIIPSADQIVESVAESGTPIPTPLTEDGDIIHYVKEGETISAIAARYEIEKEDLLLANGLRPETQLTAGDTVVVPQGDYEPVPTATPQPATPVPTLEVAREQGAEEPEETATPTPAPTRTPSTYTVQSGDLAGGIAKDYDISLSQLVEANPDVNLERLSIGQELIIPVVSDEDDGGGEAEDAGVAAAGTSLATGTPTPAPTIVATHVVQEGETLPTIAARYRVEEDSIRDYNEGLDSEPEAETVVEVPLGTATPRPTVTPTPTPTATPAPAYMAPVPLMPADGSNWVYWDDRQPPQLLWTSTGILKENEYYVVRLRAVSPRGEIIWSESHWTQSPNWRLDEELLRSTRGQATLRWDVIVMRRTSDPDERPTGVALSNKSTTFEINFSNRSDSDE